MNALDFMNYRYNNPTIALTPDIEVVKAFLAQEREKHVIEAFRLWASLSKENKDGCLEKMIEESYEKKQEQSLTR